MGQGDQGHWARRVEPALEPGCWVLMSRLFALNHENWTIERAQHQIIDAFELWSWRRLLRVPWTARTSNQSILKEINPEYSLEGLMLNLKLQYFGQLV